MNGRMKISAAALTVFLVTPAAAGAQVGGAGFLFQKPKVQLQIHTGYSVARASSDIYDFVVDSLTLKKSDFNAFSIGGQLAFRMNEHLDGAFSLTYTGATRPSEMRYWEDTNGLPIQQDTRFTRVPVTFDLKYYLMPRGRSISRFAWIPASWSPYVGGGVGVMWYTFRQSGDFVDSQSLEVFTDTFESSGHTAMWDLFAGADVSLNKSLVLTGEARYDWAKAAMGQDFVGFQKMDLSALQMNVGLGIRF